MRVWLRPVGDPQGSHERRSARWQFIHPVVRLKKLAVAVLTALSHRDDAERRAGAALQMVTRDE
jgi:hypothetical protein